MKRMHHRAASFLAIDGFVLVHSTRYVGWFLVEAPEEEDDDSAAATPLDHSVFCGSFPFWFWLALFHGAFAGSL